MLNRARKEAFTLVELLVVISIISMLMALLMVGIAAALAHVRQVRCASRLKNQALAVAIFESHKQRLPAYADSWSVSDGAGGQQTIDVGWVPQLFDYMDMKERHRRLVEWEVWDGKPAYLEPLELVICPADPPDPEQQIWSTDKCAGPAPNSVTTVAASTSYAVNCGRPDARAGDYPDSAQFGLFHDKRPGLKQVIVTTGNITDGASNTLLISENVDLTGWETVSEVHQGLVFEDGVTVRFNLDLIAPYDCDLDGFADNLDTAHARPSSYHSDGFNVAYADLNVRFFAIDNSDPNGDYRRYRSQMTPANRD